MTVTHNSLPRLLLVQLDNTNHNEYVVFNNVTPFVKLLKQDFEIFVESGDIDLQRLVERYQPNLIMYDTSCLQVGAKIGCELSNMMSHPEIPRAALITDDAHAPDKPYKLQFCQRLGVEVLFCVDSAMRSYSGRLCSKVVLVPWFVNTDTYKDYNEEKQIPIGLFGYGFKDDPKDVRYPWRRDVVLELLGKLPFVTFPRPDKKTPHDLVGEAYARMLNRCKMAFSCGGVRGVFVKKMLEIPACRTCLVVEDSPVVREMGFVDGENCLMVTAENVVSKCQHYLNNPNELSIITENGYRHVLANHTLTERRQVSDWLALFQRKQGNQRIVQLNPLEPLSLAKCEPHGVQPDDSSFFYVTLQAGIDRLSTGKFSQAMGFFDQLKKCIGFSAEVHYYIALAHLLQGDSKRLKKDLKRYIKTIRENPGFVDPSIASVVLLGLYMLGRRKDLEDVYMRLGTIDHPFFIEVVKRLKLDESVVQSGEVICSCFGFPGDLDENAKYVVDVALSKSRYRITRLVNNVLKS